jgi:3-dehydroquinate synthase
MVSKCVNFKASVVSSDERETGVRRILNFGHTYGHAIEMQMSVKHGFAVAMGIELSTEFSYSKGLISDNEKDRIISLLKSFALIGSTVSLMFRWNGYYFTTKRKLD